MPRQSGHLRSDEVEAASGVLNEVVARGRLGLAAGR